jgi:hypothetical protein
MCEIDGLVRDMTYAQLKALKLKGVYTHIPTLEEVLNTGDDNEIGYILEVDLEYPSDLQDLFKQYPPCPENISPEFEWFSEFQQSLFTKVQGNKGKTSKYNGGNKLVPHLLKHEKYCIHYRNLKFVSNLGIKITKVHNIISFKQKQWLKPYIDFNTEKERRLRMISKKTFSNL